METLSSIERKEQRINQIKRWIDDHEQLLCLEEKEEITFSICGDRVIGKVMIFPQQ